MRAGTGFQGDQAGITVHDALGSAARRLRAAYVDQPGLDARLLLGHALGVGQTDLVLRHADPIGAQAERRFEDLVRRRAAREPVSRILGTREFYGRGFEIGPAALDPRADTETLIDAALDLAASRAGGPTGSLKWPMRLADLGTGSGAILLTLLAQWPAATGVGIDISAGALRVAARNAATLGLADRAQMLCSDWDAALGGRFDLVVSNPPYIASAQIGRLDPEVARFDPHLALDGGADGLDAYRALAGLAARRLADGGCLLVEIGSGQADDVATVFAAAGLVCDAPLADLAGLDRVIAVRLKPEAKGAEREKALGMPGRSS
ncbi:Peptide chain release factor N(5)-glutamine methyltransferase [hydrothermal vent metagenome]|uniref:peptide chain release factor N(5)-glutamine methyltransferase n=1 Tax=hydrothermal vent metagenome TaxID=652676 RepID=A0A3B0T8B5_9ZZZZ